MKLILCKSCQDVVKLQRTTRACKCGLCAGKYIDRVTAVVSNNDECVCLGLDNYALAAALRRGGGDIQAFIIGKDSRSMTTAPLEKIRETS